MANYIDREAALEALSNPFTMSMCLSAEECKGMRAARDIDREIIKRIPAADVVEVRRCKNCKYRQDDNFCGGRGWPEQLVPDDGYCDKGARKEGDGE